MKLKVFYGLVLIVPELFGMSFGEVKSHTQEQQCFTEVIEKSVGVTVQSVNDAESLLTEITRAFESRKARNDESGANILFYRGKFYINRYEPTYTFNNFYLRGIKYQPVQLCDLLGFHSKSISFLFHLDENLSLINESIEKNYYSVTNFWNKACRNSEGMTHDLQQYYSSTTPEFLENHLNAAAELFKFVESSGLKPQRLNNWFLSQVKDISQMQFKQYLEAIGGYISFFNKDNGELFLRNVKNMSDYIRSGSNLLYTFREYFHTEFLVKYACRNSQSYPIHMVSYYDLCDNCEKLFAESTPEQDGVRNVVAVSAISYKNSRKTNRPESLTNKSFLQIRLNDFSSLGNTNTSQNTIVDFPSPKKDPVSYDPYVRILHNKRSNGPSQNVYNPYEGILKTESQKK